MGAVRSNPSRTTTSLGFVGGRMMSGAMVPFAFAYAYGIDALPGRRWKVAALVVLCLVMTASEIWLQVPIARSKWNLFPFG